MNIHNCKCSLSTTHHTWIKNLNTWLKGIVNVRYTSKSVCSSFFCKFIKFAHTIQWIFLQKFLFGLFYVFRELFCLIWHTLATVQPKIHLNTKFEILPLGWTKCPKREQFFLKLPVSKSHENMSKYVDTVINFAKYHTHMDTHMVHILHTCTYYVHNEWSHSLSVNKVQARQ